MAIAEITAGITAVKASLETGKSIRDLIQRPDVDRAQVDKLLHEMLIHLGNIHFAFNDLAAKMQELKTELDNRQALKAIEEDLEMDPVARYYIRKSEKERGLIPYCPTCWATESKVVPLVITQHPGSFRCAIHKVYFSSPEHMAIEKQHAERLAASRQFDFRGRDSWMR